MPFFVEGTRNEKKVYNNREISREIRPRSKMILIKGEIFS